MAEIYTDHDSHMINPFKNQGVILPDFTADFSVEIICTIRL